MFIFLYIVKRFLKILLIYIYKIQNILKKFNYVISPNHDNLNGENIINSIGALHHLNKNNNNANQNLVTCIIGGDNQHYYFDNNEANKLCNKLLEIKKNQNNLELNIVTSRRTSDLVKKILIKKLKSIAKIWIGDGKPLH